jgi:hypothetical protein
MPNDEMMRPCTLWGHTFDACKVEMISYSRFQRKVIVHFDPIWNIKPSYIACGEIEENNRFGTIQEAITAIDDALNAPVLATEQVLAGLPKDAKILVQNGNHWTKGVRCPIYNSDLHVWCFEKVEWSQEHYHIEEVRIPVGYLDSRIKSNGCSKTAEYLRQFTLDGVRKETKDV